MGEGIRIAIVDDGLEENHPDIKVYFRVILLFFHLFDANFCPFYEAKLSA